MRENETVAREVLLFLTIVQVSPGEGSAAQAGERFAPA